jgi:rRNA-processing protein FCF1
MDPLTTVLIDARNVLRSKWPNIPEEELVELARRWADERGHRAVIVFDGRSAVEAPDVVGTGGESADDWLTREAGRLARARKPFWLITSDRELRQRAGGRAERMIGGGAFARELTES